MSLAHYVHPSRSDGRPAVCPATVLLRVAGAGLLAANAAIHGYLWSVGYSSIAVIGPLFLLDVIGASVLALAVLGSPRRFLAGVAALGALLELGTAGGLFLATKVSLFGFIESTQATLYWPAIETEIAGTVALAVLAGLAFRRRSRTQPGRWS